MLLLALLLLRLAVSFQQLGKLAHLALERRLLLVRLRLERGNLVLRLVTRLEANISNLDDVRHLLLLLR